MEPPPTPDGQPKKPDSIPPLRTYERDIAELVEEKNVTLANIALAEQKRKILGGGEPSLDQGGLLSAISRRNKILVIIGSLLILISLGTTGYLILFRERPEPPTQRSFKPQIISADFTKELDIGRLNRKQLVASLTDERRRSALSPTSILRLQLVSHSENNELKREITASEFLAALQTTNPPALTRALAPEFIFGIHSLTSTEAFIIFLVKDYDNAFAGMLNFEKILPAELGPVLINERNLRNEEIRRLEAGTFEDRIIRNKDVRVLSRADGLPALLYSFPDKETLIITTNEATLQEILERLRTARLIR